MRKRVMDRMEKARYKLAEMSNNRQDEFIVGNGKYMLSKTCKIVQVNLYSDEGAKEFLEFLKKYPKPFFSKATDVDEMFLLSEKPIKIRTANQPNSKLKITGTGVLGCVTLIENCPKRLLVVDELF